MSPARVAPARSRLGQARSAQLRRARLYLVSDDETPCDDLPRLVRAAAAGGADLVQLRRKAEKPEALVGVARACREAAHAAGALLLVDDHVELALEADADGVHLGQDDMSVEAARERLGPDRLIGLSTHDMAQARLARELAVDYISAGPVNATPTKPGRSAVGLGYVSSAAALARVPVVAIGGLGPGAAGPAIAAGADMVAVVRAICRSPDPERAARELRAEIESAPPWLRIVVNGEGQRLPVGSTVSDFLGGREVAEERLVVERNGEILSADALGRQRLEEGDQLEVVHLVGGGAGDE